MEQERIIFFGRNHQFDITKICFRLLLDFLKKSTHQLVLTVVSDDHHNAPDSLESIAIKNNIPVISVIDNEVNSIEFIKKIKALNPTLFITVQFPIIFKSNLLHTASKASLNIHKGWPLRGGAINERAIFYKLQYYNIVLHHMDKGVDTGNIIAKKGFRVTKDETGYSLLKKINIYGKLLFKGDFFPLLGKPIPIGKTQDKSKTIYAAKGSLSNRIYFYWKASEIERLCRAFTHPGKEGAFFYVKNDKVFPLLPLKFRMLTFPQKIGELLKLSTKSVEIAAKDSSVSFNKCIISNRIVPLSSYLKEQKISLGYIFT